MNLMETVKMLKVHIHLIRTLIIVKIVVDGIRHVVDDNLIILLIRETVNGFTQGDTSSVLPDDSRR